jgi:hypothetical protein
LYASKLMVKVLEDVLEIAGIIPRKPNLDL